MNTVFSALFFLFLNESNAIIANNIGAIKIRKIEPKVANPDHFQNKLVSNNNVKPPRQPKTIKSLNEKNSFFSSGFKVLLVNKNKASPNVGTRM